MVICGLGLIKKWISNAQIINHNAQM